MEVLIDQEMAFAAGAIGCLLVDAFARYSLAEPSVGDRMVQWCVVNLNIDSDLASDFYRHFRCGILHEGHIKEYGQFTLDMDFQDTINRHMDYVVVNVENYMRRYWHSLPHSLKT